MKSENHEKKSLKNSLEPSLQLEFSLILQKWINRFNIQVFEGNPMALLLF